MISGIKKWLEYLYCKLLWILGFADKDGKEETANDREKITFMLRRVKQRWGKMWWVFSSLLFTLIAWQVFYFHRWYLIPVYFFQWLLFAHILWAKPSRK